MTLTPQFQHHLESHGLEVDTRGDDLADGPAIEDWPPATRLQRLEDSLKGVTTNGGRVGIFNVSHIGGQPSLPPSRSSPCVLLLVSCVRPR